MTTDFESLKKFVWNELEKLDKRLWYHGRHHTFEDVLPNAEMLAKLENCTESEILLIKTAALFHDTGFLDQYDKNEPFGCERARKALPNFGFDSESIESVCEMIMATQLPQNPKNKLAQIVCDADLGHLGMDHCLVRAEGLKLEVEQMKGIKTTIRQWKAGDLKFYENHKYFTDSARKVLQPRKEQTIQEERDFLEGK